MNDINVARQALLARDASKVLGSADLETRNKALHAMADALIDNETVILEANQLDIVDARENGIRDNIIDRLMLDHGRLAACGDALRELADLDEVLGEVIDEREIAEGIQMQQVRVPLGVVGMIYEARPNVTCDAAGIGVKTGNAMLLRGGSLARQTNAVLVDVLAEALKAQGLPSASIQAVDARDRASASDMMGMRGMIDLLIPRGGPGLITSVVENSKVPVIETGTGNCHIYIEKSADIDMARDIVVNAKCQRPSVCNAAESLLIDASIVDEVFAEVLPALTDRGVTLMVDPDYIDKARSHSSDSALIRAATEEDYGTEYLDLIISVKVVEGVEQAVEHINTYGTMHSEAIVTSDEEAAACFVDHVDAAAVYVNASTRFTDGGLFGMGAEIGISTQKLHARGPFALQALTSTKFICKGSGQTRS